MTALPRRSSELDALSTFVLVAVYLCAWLSASTASQAWAEQLGGDVGSTTATEVAWTITKILLSMWAWLLLIVLTLMVLQKYVVNTIRRGSVRLGMQGQTQMGPTVSVHGSLFTITFGAMVKTSVVVGLVSSLVLTFVFAWISMKRVLASHPRETVARRIGAIKATIGATLLFNLGVVSVTLLVSGMFLP